MEVIRTSMREPIVAPDGSEVRELVGPPTRTAASQSLAEATVLPGSETILHLHRTSEELYVFTAGAGRMRLGEEESNVTAGDVIAIAPGTPHKLWNTGREPLVLLCCCAPPYADEDTVLCE